MNILLTTLLWITYALSLYITIYWLIIFLAKKEDFKVEEKKEVSLSRFPFISVLIPAFNEEDTIIPSLESVINIDYPPDKFEIIIINDGSTDKTGEKASKFIKENKKFNIRVINQKNQGKAQSLNNALKTAKGEFFACLDADSFVESQTPKKMLSIYEKEDKNLAIVTPAMKVKSPKTFLQKIQWLEYLISLLIARLMSHLDCIYVAPGPFSLYRTSVIKKIGGFDTKNITEDQEIAYRIQKYNYRIKQCYDGYVYTVTPKNLRGLYKQRNRWLKGSFLNILKYKKLIWNKEYGDFGFMQMSINIIIFFVSITTLFFFSFYILKPIYEFIKKIYLLNFDIRHFIIDLTNFKFVLLNLDLEKIIILYLLLVISFGVIYLSLKNANEKIKKRNFLALLGYFFVYYIIMSFIIVVVFFETFLEKKHKWKF
ncbi:glycosyltransferase [Candidatus Woesearchaeota archaeon]|nr:glycosyltransferase [Candidatus Woesearchaeota archaeon]